VALGEVVAEVASRADRVVEQHQPRLLCDTFEAEGL